MKFQPPVETKRNRSNGTDRRQERVLSRLRHLLRTRRKEVRRLDDHRKSFFLDFYSLRVFSIIIAVILLSVTDAMLTLYLIRNGAAEMNLIMEHFLKYGPLPFFSASIYWQQLPWFCCLCIKTLIFSERKFVLSSYISLFSLFLLRWYYGSCIWFPLF